jgi:UDP-N-acetylmuramate--alanine ligase
MKKIHFIGIGGIGVSALARYYLAHGWLVSGSDLVESEITQALQKSGVEVYIGTKTLVDRKPDLVVFSEAVPPNNAERTEADSLRIVAYTYAQALGQLTKEYSTIAIAGAHGKSTTTAMIGLVMQRAGLDPTVIVGTKVNEFGGSNFLLGKSKYLVIEACEYAKSFLNYWPKIAVVTNVEVDHLECYDNLENLVRTFTEFAGHLPGDGVLIANGDDASVAEMIDRMPVKRESEVFSLKQPESEKLRGLLKIPGEHNIANALAALAVARRLGIDDKTSFDTLARYNGAWRRFEEHEIILDGKKVTLVADYGHHPTQIKLTLEGARSKWPDRKIVCVFQPHQALRTHLLFDDFVKVLQNVPIDRVLVTDIYQVAGRENDEISKKVSGKKLAAAVGKDSIEYVPRDLITDELPKNIAAGDALIIMGAGNIYDLAKELIDKSQAPIGT